MRDGTPKIASFGRTLDMLEAVIQDGGQRNVSALAARISTPVATAHRQIATLVDSGLLTPSGQGRHVAGPRLLALLHQLDARQVVVNVAAPILYKLSRNVRATVQLGTLDNDMVTYRIKTGHGAGDLFTKVGMQLEAYCSGIGKMLLAHLPDAKLQAYLDAGPFVPLTPNTIVAPAQLAEALRKIRMDDFAIDDCEIAEGLVCMAVPIRTAEGQVLAAISVSQAADSPRRISFDALLPMLRTAAREIEESAFGNGASQP